MRALRIPSVLALVASLALLGCGDLGTAPSLDELGPQLEVHEFKACVQESTLELRDRTGGVNFGQNASTGENLKETCEQ